MSRLNQGGSTPRNVTHEGAPVRSITAEQELRRSVLACLLWEKTFYENGQSIANRIKEGVKKCSPEFVSALALEARTDYRMRHVPLLLARELARNHKGRLVGDTINNVIQRADELTEFCAMYAQDHDDGEVKPVSKQVKTGLARAFQKFDAYQLAKYNRKNPITLRDVLFLVHPKPKHEGQAATWKQLANNSLPTPDTWETNLSAGKDKGETFTRLMQENKLGYMALLRNLRNMLESGVDRQLIKDKLIEGAMRSKALPFRFIAAWKVAAEFERELDAAMQLSMEGMERMPGDTAILIDCSGSMTAPLSAKSTMTYKEAGAALAILANGVCPRADTYAFGDVCKPLPPRQGLALMDAVLQVNQYRSYYEGERDSINVGHGTNIGGAVRYARKRHPYERIIVVTDGQSHDVVPNPGATGYIFNVAAYKNGVGYGQWNNIDGFSEASIRWMQELERTTED